MNKTNPVPDHVVMLDRRQDGNVVTGEVVRRYQNGAITALEMGNKLWTVPDALLIWQAMELSMKVANMERKFDKMVGPL